ncbi:Thiopurine S-methyltransferase [Armadillidium vulgare]|nr:Thiopurine S-methyltransferase [Armadillidium vulgare]
MSARVYSVFVESKDSYSFWEKLWSTKLTPFHQKEVCPFLLKNSSNLNFASPKRVFIPLCGKALELKWFYDQGFEVVGVELISIPVEEFFKEQNLSFKIRELPWAKVYESSDQRIKIYVADIFSVEPEEVGKFDVIWARADYTIVKIAEREKYSKLMKQLCKEKFVYFYALYSLRFLLVDMILLPDHFHTKKQENYMVSYKNNKHIIIIIYKSFDKLSQCDWCKVDLIEEEDGLKYYPQFKSSGIDTVRQSCFILTPK